MRFLLHVKIILLGWLLLSCETPFTSDQDDDTFQVTHDFEGGPRLTEAVLISLSWSRITLSMFEKYVIHRSVLEGSQEVWALRGEITDPLQVTFTDTINDDQTFRYRIRIVDSNGDFQEAKTEQIVVRTTSIVVPDEYECLQDAYDTPFIDDGDTIYVKLPITVCTITNTLEFLTKDVHIRSTAGRDETVLKHSGQLLRMSLGTLSGFTLTKGAISLSGSAIMEDCLVTGISTALYFGTAAPLVIDDSAQVRNCTISDNHNLSLSGLAADGGSMIVRGNSTIKNCRITQNSAYGSGGAILVDGNPTIINCIIDNNYAENGGGGLFLKIYSQPLLINCVIYGNNSGGTGDFGAVMLDRKYTELEMLNSIVWGNSSAGSEERVWENSTYCDIKGYDEGTGNINSPPLFVDALGGNFHLDPDSPCIDTGHPGEEYRDGDGSRNDMGAYGGPDGDWE